MKNDILAYFEERFGIAKKEFEGFRLYADRKGRVMLGPKGIPLDDKAISVGMQIARVGNDMKPSTNFLQLFGRHATKNSISLTKEQTHAYLMGEDVQPSGKVDATDGYVLLKYLDYPLACGLLKNKTIKNVLPKPRRMDAKHL